MAVESMQYQLTSEIASGSQYNGRRDLGNTRAGDGARFKGRGLIQLTGRANYKEYGRKLNQNFVSNPTLVARFPWALEVSALYWKTRFIIGRRNRRGRRPIMRGMTLNKLADQNERLYETSTEAETSVPNANHLRAKLCGFWSNMAVGSRQKLK